MPLHETQTVVIVDDDEAILAALARLVRTFGYEPGIFTGAEALLHAIGRVRPACMLTDIQMPGMNGIDLLKEVRQWFPGLPTLVMTAYPSLTNQELVGRDGATEYMTKPLDDRRLEDWLCRTIGKPGAP